MVMNNDYQTFISRYDNALMLVAYGLDSLEQEVNDALEHTPSVLSAFARVGDLVARIFNATALSEQYLEQKLWLDHPERLQEDEYHYGMMLHYVSGKHLEHLMTLVQCHLSICYPNDFDFPAMAEIEMALLDRAMTTIPEGLFTTIKNALLQLTVNLRDIFHESHPQHSGPVAGRIPQGCPTYSFVTDPEALILQQAYAVQDFTGITSDFFLQQGSWAWVSSEMLIQLCELSRALSALHRNSDSLSVETLQTAASHICQSMKATKDKLAEMEDEYLKIGNTITDEEMIEAIAASPYPLQAHNAPVVLATVPFQFMLLSVMEAYGVCLDAFQEKITAVLAGKGRSV